MRKSNPLITVSQRRTLRHGGAEVVRLYTERLSGESALCAHCNALAEALEDYTRREIFPAACAALERAVREGRGYAFCAHTCRISFQSRTVSGLLEVTLRFLHAQGREIQRERTLRMYWTPDGALQCRARTQKQTKFLK